MASMGSADFNRHLTSSVPPFAVWFRQLTGSTAAMEHDVEHFDLAIIGLGSAGENLARTMAQKGARVIGFEPALIGGECPFLACMPSKALLHDAAQTDRSWSETVARREQIVNERDDSEHADDLRDAGVVIVRETARIAGEHHVRSETTTVRASHVVIATGAATAKPPIDGIDLPIVWTSADALSTAELPESLLIIGCGAIGSELGEVYARHGADVTIIERSDQAISGIDPEQSDALTQHLCSLGIKVVLGSEVERISETDAGASVTDSSGRTYEVARVLSATGTTPRLEGLGLDSIGLDSDPTIASDGAVGGLPWLFAAGDVTPDSQWTHGANFQAERLARRFSGEEHMEELPVMPSCIFTTPPLGRVGLSRVEAVERGHEVVVGRGGYRDIARHATDELHGGSASIVADSSTGLILGASVFGPRADDLIHVVTALMVGSVDVEAGSRMVFAFPTISQVVQVALKDAADQLSS